MGPFLRPHQLTLLLGEAKTMCCKLELVFLQISLKIIGLGRGSYTDPFQEWEERERQSPQLSIAAIRIYLWDELWVSLKRMD